MKDAMQPQDSCATLESHNIKSVHMVNKLETILYHVDHDPMIPLVCVMTQGFEPYTNMLRPRRLQRNLPYSLSSRSRVDMALQSGPTIHFSFPYISKLNGWQV